MRRRANPVTLTGQCGCGRPRSERCRRPESLYRSSYSTPARMPNTHQVTWSWMRVRAGLPMMATSATSRVLLHMQEAVTVGRYRAHTGKLIRGSSSGVGSAAQASATCYRVSAPALCCRHRCAHRGGPFIQFRGGRTVRVFMVSSSCRCL